MNELQTMLNLHPNQSYKMVWKGKGKSSFDFKGKGEHTNLPTAVVIRREYYNGEKQYFLAVGLQKFEYENGIVYIKAESIVPTYSEVFRQHAPLGLTFLFKGKMLETAY